MSARTFLVFWNELSFPDGTRAEHLQADPAWRARALRAFKGLRELFKLRADCRVFLCKGQWGDHVGGRPLHSWLEDWLGKDGVRFLKTKAVVSGTAAPPFHEFDCELSSAGRSGEGLTRAHVAETWTWSVGSVETSSDAREIEADKITAEAGSVIKVRVANIAIEDHVSAWKQELIGWGHQPSNNHTVAVLGRYTVVMYPFDHGYPHIHVRSQNDTKLNAKFRVDCFEPLTYDHPEGLDALMSVWIKVHEEALLASWFRCQRGRHPLRIED